VPVNLNVKFTIDCNFDELRHEKNDVFWGFGQSWMELYLCGVGEVESGEVSGDGSEMRGK
jgi:hypothetical protein